MTLIREEVEAKVISAICEQCGLMEDEVKPESKLFDDLGADSLDAVELAMTLEEEDFGEEIAVSNEEIDAITTSVTVKEIVDLIMSKAKP